MSLRVERLGALLKKDLAEIIQREYQPDGTFVTVTNVRVTPDLAIAKVYLSVFAPGRDDQVVYEFIDEQVPAIRHKLAGKIKNQVRKIPELHFYADDTADYVNKMETLFKKVDEQPKAPLDDNEEE
jgi:ribosome-binding factor A